MNYERILKTGVLAVAATIAFAIFAYRAAEWSKGLNSEMIVLGQGTNGPGGGSGCSTGGTGTGSAQIIKVIPQIAMDSLAEGQKYATIIEVVNTSGADQNITGNFYKEDGSPLDNSPLTVTTSTGTSTINNGVLTTTSIKKDGILIISAGGRPTPGGVGWGKLTGCSGLSVATFFELRESGLNTLLSRVGVAASPANMSSFVIPRVREVATGLDIGFAVANTGSEKVTLTAELKDADGTTVKTTSVDLNGGAHKAVYPMKEFFAPLDEQAIRVYQYVKFTSSKPSVAAVALAIEGSSFTSFPVDVLQ